jgi:hypothetical protein
MKVISQDIEITLFLPIDINLCYSNILYIVILFPLSFKFDIPRGPVNSIVVVQLSSFSDGSYAGG